MPTEYSLQDLAKLADVTPRTIRYYIAQGLLPSPTQLGPAARYTEAHLELLRVIKKLQGAHLPLAEIRARLRGLPAMDLRRVAEEAAEKLPSDSALDYINRILVRPAAMRAPASMPSMREPSEVALPRPQPLTPPAQAPTPEPDRAQWERITLGPDVELHVRRPLTRQHNKRVERLISIARQLLEED